MDGRLAGPRYFGLLGILANVPALLIYGLFIASRVAYKGMSPISWLIPSSEAAQITLLAGLPVIGLVFSLLDIRQSPTSRYGRAGLVVSTLLLSLILLAAFGRSS